MDSALHRRQSPGQGFRTEFVVDPHLHLRNVLVEDRRKRHRSGLETSKRPLTGKALGLGAEVEIIVLDIGEPVVRERPFQAGTDGPADAGLAGTGRRKAERCSVETGDTDVVAVMSESRASLAVE